MSKRIALFALTVCLLTISQTAFADGFIVVERPPQNWRRRPIIRRHFPLSVKVHHVKVEIKGALAITHVDQTFHNPNPVQLEGTYIFPLPKDAALSKFSMFMDGKEVEGEVLDKGKAAKIYTGIVQRMQDPALLEYMGRGIFKCRIFPIPARGDKRIKLSYSQVIKPNQGRCQYRYSLNTEKFSSTPLNSVSVKVEIENKTPIKSVFSPSHTAAKVTRKDDKHASLVWEASHTKPDQDFQVNYDLSQKDLGLSVWNFARPAEDGYFLVTITPKVDIAQKELPAKDIIFVFDTSGSMLGEKMKQAKAALRSCVLSLNSKDRFNIVPFSTEARPFREGLVPASEDVKKAAAAHVDGLKARGGTAIHEALLTALDMKPKESKGRPFMVVFMTDGQPTIGETRPDLIKKAVLKAAKGTRIFTLGIGTDVNIKMLDGIAEATKAEQEYVLPSENIEVKISSFYDKFAYPVMTDCELHFEGVWVKEVYPKKLPDLFKGGTLHVVGRYKGEGAVAVRLRGQVSGKAVEHVLEGKFDKSSDGLEFLPARWAKQKIGYLLDQIRLNGAKKELKDEVIALAKRYGLPTPYTSYLVVEENAVPPPRPNNWGGRRPGRGRGGRDGLRPMPMGPSKPKAEPQSEPEDSASDAFRRLAKARRKNAEKKGNSAPSAGADKDSGQGAVERSLGLKKLKRGEGSATEGIEESVVRKIMRTVGSKTFYNVKGRWIDSLVKKDAKPELVLTALSPEYFEFLTKNPDIGPIIALGKNVVFMHKGKVVQIQAKASK